MYSIININGATLIYSPVKDLETAALGVFVKIGSRYEKKPLRGISHFLEHMLFKGSRKYSYRQIAREIEGRGGNLNGYTSEECTGYHAHFLSKNLEPTLDILLDMVSNPLLKATDIKKERSVILEEIKMYNDQPSSRASMLMDKLLWSNHPLSDQVIGDFSTVKRIDREDLLNFKECYYQPANFVISFCGNYTQEKIVQLLNEKIKKYSSEANLKTVPPKPLRSLHIKVESKKLEQSYVCLGLRGVSYLSKDKTIAQLVNIILGANMSSRLFEEIREKKGLCYSIYSQAIKYKDCGAFIIQLGLDKSKIDIAIAAILKELNKIKEICIGQKELDRAKDYFLGNLAMQLEHPAGRMFYLAENYLSLGKIYSLADVKHEIEKINAHDIMSFSSQIFNLKNMCISCVGNVEPGIEGIIRDTVSSFC